MNSPFTLTEQEFLSYFTSNEVPVHMRAELQRNTFETRSSYQLVFPNGHKVLLFCDDLQAGKPIYDMYADGEYITRLNYEAVQAQFGRISRKSQFIEPEVAVRRSLVMRILVITLMASVLLTAMGWFFFISTPHGQEIARKVVPAIIWPVGILNALLVAGIWYQKRHVKNNS